MSAANGSKALIEAGQLTKEYGEITAVDRLDLRVDGGEVFGLLGPNGAGKTTTILMLLGLSEPTSGSVRVCGLDPTRHPLAVKRQVGYLPDAVGFYDHLTGRENLHYTARLNELEAEQGEARVNQLLELVGLTDDADRAVGEYSRGMKQRLGIADVLIKEPSVVILDEPTSAIDPEGAIGIQRLISSLAHEEGLAVLVSSHLLNQMQQICDRVAIFVAGRIVAQGSPRELGRDLGEGRAIYEITAETSERQLREALVAELGDAEVEVAAQPDGRWRIALPDEDSKRLIPALIAQQVELHGVRDLGSDLDQIYHRYFAKMDSEVG